ncbi:MAG: response regulator [Pirellulales bacterium]|nr:response regulator [Pirellulales bacterium]
MNDRILCVDDDYSILRLYQHALSPRFYIETALGGAEGLVAITQNGPYAVVVADMSMPGMNGIEFLRQVQQRAPDTVRMMLTAHDDSQTALDAVNEGRIFRFLTKPCSPPVFGKALEAALAQYHLLTAERELLANTLRGSIQVLTEVLSLVNPLAFARASRVRNLVVKLNRELGTNKSWLYEIAAMLSQIGCVTVPQEIFIKANNREPLSPGELKMLQGHPEVARSLLAHIPRLEEVSAIIAQQDALNDSDQAAGKDVPFGSRILKVALDFDGLVSGGMDADAALAEIDKRDGWYDPGVVSALHRALHIAGGYTVRQVTLAEMNDGALLAEDVYSRDGLLLCAKGQEVTRSMRVRLRNYIVNVGLQSPLKIILPVADSEKILSTDADSAPDALQETLLKDQNLFDVLASPSPPLPT